MQTNNIIEEVTMKIMLLLDKVVSGDVEFWLPLSGLAYNPITKHTYTSINQLLLSYEMFQKNYSINNWMTFKQVTDLGGSIVKGEKSTHITFSEVIYLNKKGDKITPKEAKLAFSEAKAKDPTISTYRDAGISTKRFLRYYFVFNVAQTKGLSKEITEPQLAKLSHKDRSKLADEIMKIHRINVKHVAGNSAHFEVNNDIIQMPFIEQFNSTESYYATLFHEMIHWTGHNKRLNRQLKTKDKTDYAFEELIAELGSAFLCAHFQLPASLTSTTAYIKSWLAALQNDHSYILKAVGHAERAMNFLLEKQTISVYC
jgi:antirestriction protein ArdC